MQSPSSNKCTVAVPPLFVFLADGEKERLPSSDYIRVVAQHMGTDGKVRRNDYALHNRGARMCRLLDSLLDSVDVDLRCKMNPVSGHIPPVTLPQATREGCECVFTYLDLVQNRVPTLLSKPLRAPVEELVQPWEIKFILENCFGTAVGSESSFKNTTAFFKTATKEGPPMLDRVLEVAMLSDFLIIESLRDLCCAFLASLGLSATSEKDLLQLCGLDAPLSEEEMEPLYAQFPFLRPQPDY